MMERRAMPKGLEDSSLKLTDVLLQAIVGKTTIDVSNAMSIPAFAGCVNAICNTIATVPIYLYEKKNYCSSNGNACGVKHGWMWQHIIRQFQPE